MAKKQKIREGKELKFAVHKHRHGQSGSGKMVYFSYRDIWLLIP